MSMRHASVLLLATACSSQSALIGEQDEPVDAASTSSVGGSTSTSSGTANATTSNESTATGGAGAPAITGTDGTTPFPELGPCEDTTEIMLSPEAIAARLSKLMFDSKPSAELLAAAQKGELSTYGAVECKALEMLEQPEHEAGLLAFLDAWLEVSSWQHQPLPDLPENLWTEMQTEATTFLESFVASGDTTVAHLLEEPETRVGAALAEHYGVEPLPEDDSELVMAPGHRGLLSLGLVTASLRRIGPRGYYVANKFLCLEIAVPAGVSQAIPRTEGESYRNTYDSLASGTACAVCHMLFDGPGHALENFDELGRWQEVDGDAPVRTDGKLVTDFTGVSLEAFDDTSEFIDELSQNPLVGSCLARRAAGFSSGMDLESVDEALSERDLQKVVGRFEDSERDLGHVLVGLTQTDLFWQ